MSNAKKCLPSKDIEAAQVERPLRIDPAEIKPDLEEIVRTMGEMRSLLQALDRAVDRCLRRALGL